MWSRGNVQLFAEERPHQRHILKSNLLPALFFIFLRLFAGPALVHHVALHDGKLDVSLAQQLQVVQTSLRGADLKSLQGLLVDLFELRRETKIAAVRQAGSEARAVLLAEMSAIQCIVLASC